MAINMKDVIEIDAIPKYVELEYIHLNKAEYIPTGLYLTLDKYLEITAKPDTLDDSGTLLGLEDDCEIGYIFNALLNSVFFGTYGSSKTIVNDEFTIGAAIHKVSGSNELYLTYQIDQSGSLSLSANIYSSETTIPGQNIELCLGCVLDTGGTPKNNWKGNVYKFELKSGQSGTTEYNFVPAKRYIDGVAGLYETISKTFYPMSGTTTTGTACGPEVSILERYGTKKIEDSNGNIIWGSRSAFPYRRLEYIHFNGAEYINTNKTVPGNTQYKRIDMYCKYLDLSGWTGNGYYSNSNNKLMLGTTASAKTQFAVGSQYAYNSSDLISLDTNNYYFWLLWSNNGYTTLGLYRNPDETGQVGVTNTYSYTFNTASGNLYIGAYLDGRSNTLAGYCNMDLKTFAIRTGSYANAIFNGIPCQRKSDGVCGMYDITTSTFCPMEGTNITDAAAGPVVDEYWDLTA